ncbi:MAG: tRNA lysidine(34) synthetase TilS, partial [Muribaculaceae bacterium]|nr:tRNA lysidine(34) synthetase TilS [Muribaculaceae bacterium]
NILPFIEQNFDNGVERIGRSIERIADGVAFFNEMVEEKRRQYFDLDTMSIDLGRLFQSETSARLLLVEWLREYGLGASVVDDVIKARRESGRRFGVTRSGYWLLNRGKLRYVQKSERSTTSAFVSLDSAPFTMEIISGGDIPRETDYYSAFFDISILDGNPVFELRSWQRGDRMKPFGMTGSKKLSDIFRDAAIPDNEKSSPIVLTRNGEIIWLIGLRHSRLYPVSPTSPRFLKLTYHK